MVIYPQLLHIRFPQERMGMETGGWYLLGILLEPCWIRDCHSLCKLLKNYPVSKSDQNVVGVSLSGLGGQNVCLSDHHLQCSIEDDHMYPMISACVSFLEPPFLWYLQPR